MYSLCIYRFFVVVLFLELDFAKDVVPCFLLFSFVYLQAVLLYNSLLL